MKSSHSIQRIFDILLYQYQHHPKRKLFRYKEAEIWKEKTVREFVDLGNNISAGLLQRGIQKGDHIVLICNSRWEWHLLDFAISQVGAITIPFYPTLQGEEYQMMIEECGAKIIFVGTNAIYNALKTQACITQKRLPVFSIAEDIEHIPNYQTLIPSSYDSAQIEAARSQVDATDLATIIYTSGTEGIPKGVMLSHHNIVSNVRSTSLAIPSLSHRDIALSFLPLNHIYEKTVTYVYMYVGCQINYAESLATVAENAREVRPTVFASVPLLMKKIHDRIIQKGTELCGIKKALFFWAVRLTQQWEPQKPFSLSYSVKRFIADKLIYKKWRQALGGRVRITPSGSAAIQPAIIRFFQGAGIHLLEGYGLTETSPIVSVNRLEKENIRLGSVGVLIDDVEAKIANDGEILIRGENVMMGYYKRPKETAEVLTPDGWLHTGDIGTIEDGKFLKILDRKKEMFKTAGGKYVAPQLLEIKIKESPLVEHVMVLGSDQAVVAAIIQPQWEQLILWAKTQQIEEEAPEVLIKHPQVRKLYDSIIAHANRSLHPHEYIRRFELVADTWSSATGELTPNMKIKRRVILEKYRTLYQKIYPSSDL